MALKFAVKRHITLRNAVEFFKQADGRDVNPNLGLQSALNDYERQVMQIDNSIITWSGACSKNGEVVKARPWVGRSSAKFIG